MKSTDLHLYSAFHIPFRMAQSAGELIELLNHAKSVRNMAINLKAPSKC